MSSSLTESDAPLSEPGSSFKRAVSRRTLVAGAAWSVPVVALATATPAMAASAGECLPDDTLFNSKARGTMLSGTLAGKDLATIADLHDVTAEAFGAAFDEQSDPLAVTALSGITVDLGGTAVLLTEILSGLIDADAGLVNQYAYAHENGDVRGASGAVGDDGTLDTAPGDGWPELASLDLHRVLTHLTGSGVADLVDQVAGLDLSIGAVAGRTAFNSLCTPPEDLNRDYLIAYLKTILTSNTIGGLVDDINTAISGLTGGLVDLINAIPLLGLVLDVDSLSLQLGTTPTPAGDGHPLQITLGDPATVTVDLGALLGGAYTGTESPWLNNLPANTRLFVDTPLPTEQATAAVTTLINAVLEAVQIDIRARAVLQRIQITGSLADLLSGTATVQPGLAGLTSALLKAIGEVIKNALLTNNVLGPLTTALNAVLGNLFTVLTEVIVLTVNAQNDADGAIPPQFHLPMKQYDVAALHIGAVNYLNLLNLYLARGSGGANTVR